MTVTVKDFFCGAGGMSEGLRAAGFDIVLAANHWDRAIESHAANFPDTEHLCADVNNFDMRRLPKTRGLVGSPICTEVSPANGQQKQQAQLELEQATGDHVPRLALDRTRATAYDFLRAAEVHDYEFMLLENVPNFAHKWPLYDWWLGGMCMVGRGYNLQVISVNSAHVWSDDNDPAPQWRDRIYMLFTRKDIALPDVRPRPLAFCDVCDEVVRTMQWWKDTPLTRRRKVGSYGDQYVYRCANRKCDHQILEPYIAPAIGAIDLTDLGTRIGDRKKPLVPATRRRIQVGVETFWEPVVAAVHGNTWEKPGSAYARVWPALSGPLQARTGTPGDGIALPAPFIAELRGGGSTARSTLDPLATVTAGGNHHGLTLPPGAFIQKHHGGLDYARIEHMVKSPMEPLPTVVGKPNLSLVIPFRRGAQPARLDAAPLSTVTTREAHGVLAPAIDIDDCYFRMLKPREHLRAQRFPDSYVVLGNQGEVTMQAGNAVSTNVPQWIGRQLLEVLEPVA